MSEYKSLLENALANITNVRNEIIKEIETESDKDEPNELRIYHLSDYKIELLDQKMRLEGLIRNIHLIQGDKKV